MKHQAVVPVCLVVAVTVAAVTYIAYGQVQSVVNSPHNLSASGPGSVRASSEQEICIFCHAPHNSSKVQPLWNRYESAAIYTPYSSSSMTAEPGQPTGSSKLCLSCHDGTIALGKVVSRSQPIHMVGGVTVMPQGHANLGTDLSDDHPISFRYDTSLAIQNGNLVDPRALPPAMKLDHNQELQCTTCHDPHNNVYGKFLVMSNENSAMCRSCHTISNTTVQEHTDCANCHQPHSAPSGPHLLRGADATETCLSCHDGTHSSAQNIAAEMNRLSAHGNINSMRAGSFRSPGAPGSRSVSFAPSSSRLGAARTDNHDAMMGHAGVGCTDCHDPHTMHPGGFAAKLGSSRQSEAPYLQPALGSVSGVSASGMPIDAARFEYEVCYKCHADNNVIHTPTINRQVMEPNMRMVFGQTAASAHPVQSAGRGTANSVPSLKPEWRGGRMVYCSDCHGSDTGRKAGGTGPDGVHGSSHPGLLIARYETADFTMESPQAYTLCYSCHERDGTDGILSDRSFRFHRLHIVDNRTPCSACHDSHGVSAAKGGNRRNNAYLMNFDLSIVSPDPVTGRLEYRDNGSGSGTCYLNCHGVAHSPKEY
jgi:predicted CXXCH cytochrome family protein